jgi:hypothetical protein
MPVGVAPSPHQRKSTSHHNRAQWNYDRSSPDWRPRSGHRQKQRGDQKENPSDLSEQGTSSDRSRRGGPVCFAGSSHSGRSVPSMSVRTPLRGDPRFQFANLTAPERRDNGGRRLTFRAREVFLLSCSTRSGRDPTCVPRPTVEDRRRQESRSPQVRVRRRTGHRVEGLDSLRRHLRPTQTALQLSAIGVHGAHTDRCTIP